MRSSSPSRSVVRAVAWAYLAPLVVIGGLALFLFGLGALAVLVQLVPAVFRHL